MSREQKRKSAVALGYDRTMDGSPRVMAKGNGLIAEEILRRAEEHDIPVQEDETLVGLLGQLDINESIPEELYGAVAEVFAFIYRVDKSFREEK
ncbi:EscU/YscU/HrcU family type III secretion system export apparatus switch protein [Rossellomorea marisflavi]|uniref:EscU/YscU/HrcU family type III secretion system export apparatus switch protein n=1 Tax=Rossellomorea marisflavi TaxID=189381 RepID=UPI00204040BA|nr:EscU/YscU/HrcU family type III secretion system export apparatus switch protein [Rossellomorea marisflavi]MCM2588683.1 EscU/YscU/HrcU family type III secretion system export apparatus switch protein [Rossellomorea marisflavi]MDW4526475.1 EscU/YscU/HrcU family type III secretion system export apparatus switch protein [Rossellomorea marisflavi]